MILVCVIAELAKAMDNELLHLLLGSTTFPLPSLNQFLYMVEAT